MCTQIGLDSPLPHSSLPFLLSNFGWQVSKCLCAIFPHPPNTNTHCPHPVYHVGHGERVCTYSHLIFWHILLYEAFWFELCPRIVLCLSLCLSVCLSVSPSLFLFQDGVWIKGLFLEGAGWDKRGGCLVEASPMQLVCPMPTIHFKPSESKRRSAKGLQQSLHISICLCSLPQ